MQNYTYKFQMRSVMLPLIALGTTKNLTFFISVLSEEFTIQKN